MAFIIFFISTFLIGNGSLQCGIISLEGGGRLKLRRLTIGYL